MPLPTIRWQPFSGYQVFKTPTHAGWPSRAQGPKQRLVARPRLSSLKTKCQFKETTSQTIIATHHSTKRQERAVIHRESKHPISYQTDALEIGQTLLHMALGCNHTNSRCTLDVDCTNNKHTESNLRNRNEAPFLARGNPT